MEEDEITITRDGDELVIRVPLHKPTPSSTGKTQILATSHGVMFTVRKYKGKDIALNFNAFVFTEPKRPRRTAETED